MPRQKEKIILLGGGGHAKVVIDAIRSSGKFSIYGIFDPHLAVGRSIMGVKVLGNDRILPKLKNIKYAFISVGSVGNCDVRKKIYRYLKTIGLQLPVIAHPTAIIARNAKIKEGAFMAARAVVNSGAKIGRNAIINTASSVDHDCRIGDFVHIGPGVALSGDIKIGNETHIGTGARIIQNLTIGSKCMVGAGVTIRQNLKSKTHIAVSQPSFLIKPDRKVFIIAEAGVNHNGNLQLAKRMVDIASDAGADAIKFQTFSTKDMISASTPKAKYQKDPSNPKESQKEMLKRLELNPYSHKELVKYCKEKGITFLSTPFDIGSVNLLNKLGMRIFKVPSGEITNLPYLKKIGNLKKKIILSTGISSMEEISEALTILTKNGTPKKDITVLHCNTAYPTPMKDTNLLAMLTIRDNFKISVGYSDHTKGIEVPIAAVALGANVIEKHFTLDRNLKGPDHRFSIEPKELKEMVMSIRNIEKALGDGSKNPSKSELKNRIAVRKSIVATRNIKKGEFFTKENLAVKRPGSGISPLTWDSVIGKKAVKGFRKDELIAQ